MLLILQMIVERRGQVDVVDFANRMYTWMRQGFQELGDTRTYVRAYNGNIQCVPS